MGCNPEGSRNTYTTRTYTHTHIALQKYSPSNCSNLTIIAEFELAGNTGMDGTMHRTIQHGWYDADEPVNCGSRYIIGSDPTTAGVKPLAPVNSETE